MNGFSPAKIPRYLKWIKVLTLLISGVVTLAVLVTFWSWLGPATFWQKVAGFLLSIGGGIVLFFLVQTLLMMLMGVMFSKYIQREMMNQFQGFQGFQQGPEGPTKPEDDEDNGEDRSESNEGSEDSDEVMYQ